MSKIDDEAMDQIMAEIAKRLRAFEGYPHAFDAHTESVRRAEVFDTIAYALTAPRRGAERP